MLKKKDVCLRLRGVQRDDLSGGDAAAAPSLGLGLPPRQQLMADRGAQAHQLRVELEDVDAAAAASALNPEAREKESAG